MTPPETDNPLTFYTHYYYYYLIYKTLLVFAVVFPRYGYVCASKTMALRRLLDAANSDTGFTNQEKGMWVCDAAVPLDYRLSLPIALCKCMKVVCSCSGMLSCCCRSAHQILKSSSTSFSSSSESIPSSRSGDLNASWVRTHSEQASRHVSNSNLA